MSDTLRNSSWTDKPTFKKRRGTTDLGKDYEEAMVALTCLQLVLDDDIADFNVASNVDNFGSFDDLIVNARHKNGQEINEAIQLKHVERNHFLTKEALESLTGDFSLLKYYSENHQFLERGFMCVLHTNRKFNGINEKLSLKFKEKETLVVVCRESSNTYRFRIHTKQQLTDDELQYQKFFDQFRLRTEQENNNNTNKRVEGIFLNALHGSPAAFADFRQFIKDWSTKSDNKYILSKKIVLMKLAETVLSPCIKTISSSHHNVGQNGILRKAILEFDLTVFEDSNQIIDKMWINNNRMEVINKVGFQNFIITKPLIEGDLKSKEYSIISWYLGASPLIVDSANQEAVFKILELFAINEMKKKFIVLNCQSEKIKTLNNLKKFRNLHDLQVLQADLFTNIIAIFPCRIRGYDHKLEDFLDADEELLKVFTVDAITEMANGNLQIGGEKEELPQFYVSRILQSDRMINFSFINAENSNHLIIISCNGQEDNVRSQIDNARNVINVCDLEASTKERKDNFIYLTSGKYAQNDFDKISRHHSAKLCYHFEYFDKNLMLIKTTGDVDTLKNFKIKPENELNLLRSSRHAINLVCADPGFGKSTMMKYFKNSYGPKFWPLCIDSRECAVHISEKQDVEEFALSFSNNSFEKKLLRVLYKRRKIVFIWDALDEIFHEGQKGRTIAFIQVIKKLGFRQWVTSRVNLKDELENRLDTFARNIREFDNEQQKRYINDRLKGKLPQDQISTVFAKIHKNSKFLETNNILGIPLQLFVLTEVLRQNPDNIKILNNPLTITKLYEYFIYGKLRFFSERSGVTHPYYAKRTEEMFMMTCEVLGTRICLESVNNLEFLDLWEKYYLSEILKETDPIGIIIHTSGVPTFYHQSYAEYFCALFLSKHHSRIANFEEIYFDERFNNVRFMFDLILAKDCPLHAAVLYKDLKIIKEHEGSHLVKDLGGRTALHVALSWERQYWREYSTLIGSWKKNNAMFIIKFGEVSYANHYLKTVERCLKKLEISKLLLSLISKNQEVDFNSRDTIFGYDCFAYANTGFWQIALSTKSIEVIKFAHRHLRLGNRDDASGLMISIFFGNFEMASFLTEFRTRATMDDDFGSAALISATIHERLEIVKLLLKKKADVNCLDKHGWTPLMWASYCGNLKIVAYLLDHKANMELVNDDDDTPLTIAIKYNNFETAEFLIKREANINYSSKSRCTPLMLAVNLGKTEIVELLIDEKADIEMVEKSGRTAFFMAVEGNHFEVAKVLVRKGANVNCCDNNGWTPLMKAAGFGNLEMVKLLVDNEAHLLVASANGSTPLDIAIGHNQAEVATFLRKNTDCLVTNKSHSSNKTKKSRFLGLKNVFK